jgi:hypothetical protein
MTYDQSRQPPPGYYQPPQAPPPKKRHILRNLSIGCGGLIGLIVIIAVIAAVAGGGKTASPPASPGTTAPGGSTAPAAATGPGIGSKARDGKFQFVVTSVGHRKSVGDTADGLGETAQGMFTVLHITVTNISNVAQTLDDSAQLVFDSRGRQFSADSVADIDANQGNGGGVFFNSINPGNSVQGVILFDLPAGDKAVTAQLHDSAFSGGVTVSLVSR